MGFAQNGVSTYNIPRDIFSYNPPAQCDKPEEAHDTYTKRYQLIDNELLLKIFQNDLDLLVKAHLAKFDAEAERVTAKKITNTNLHDRVDKLEFYRKEAVRFAKTVAATATQDLEAAYAAAKGNCAAIVFKEDHAASEKEHPGFVLHHLNSKLQVLEDLFATRLETLRKDSDKFAGEIQAWVNAKLDEDFVAEEKSIAEMKATVRDPMFYIRLLFPWFF